MTRATLSFLITTLFFTSGLFAQAEKVQLHWGGLGYAFVGIPSTEYLTLQDNLDKSKILGAEASRSGFGFGGGGMVLLGNRFAVLGNGFGSIYPIQSPSRVDINLSQAGGGFALGTAVTNTRKNLIVPYLGVVASGSRLQINNASEASVRYGFRNIPANSSSNFTLSSVNLDIGFNYFQLINIGGPSDLSGMTIGVSAGYQPWLRIFPWEDEGGAAITELAREAVQTFYFRIIFGGGGFFQARPK